MIMIFLGMVVFIKASFPCVLTLKSCRQRLVREVLWNSHLSILTIMNKHALTRSVVLSICLLPLAFGPVAQAARSSSSGWEHIAAGIDYKMFSLPGPNRAHVARLDREQLDVILESSIAQGRLSGGLETVSGMVERYDGAINAWGDTWGARNHVVVAINGSFYDPGTGIPQGGVIHSGWYSKWFDELSGISGLSWKEDHNVFLGQCVYHRPDKQLLTNLTTGDRLEIHGVNTRPQRDQLILLTPQFDRDSQRESKGIDVLVELTRPAMLMPFPHMVTGIVREVRIAPGSTPIPFDHVVLSGWGDIDDQLVQFLMEGDAVGLSFEITHLDQDCKYAAPEEWTKSYASVAGNIIFLYEGKIQEFEQIGALLRHPRTAICYNQDYLYFVVIDGRDDAYSVGMTILELANFCKEKLQATEGINLDGGGSSTMWVNGEVVNRPSDGHERNVANGVMMVIVEPMEKSSSFSPGTQVTAQYPTNIHLGPGTNFPALTSVDTNTRGTVIYQWDQLNGVLAKGAYWWKIDFFGVVGWVDEAALSAINDDPVPSTGLPLGQ